MRSKLFKAAIVTFGAILCVSFSYGKAIPMSPFPTGKIVSAIPMSPFPTGKAIPMSPFPTGKIA